MRNLSTATSAEALGVAPKALDNLLTREARRLLPRGRRGRARRIPLPVVERVAVALILRRDLGVSHSRGLELAGELLASSGEVLIGSLGTLRFDVSRLRVALQSALADAAEEVVVPRRGRPPKRT